MTMLHLLRRPLAIVIQGFILFSASLGCAHGQIATLEEHLEVSNLPTLVATSHDPTVVLLASLDTILHDKDICCGKDSALLDTAESADPRSLKEIATKLDGRHLLSDGRPIKVTTDYLTPEQATAGHFVVMLRDQHAALMLWNSHLYVLHGLIYVWSVSSAGDGEVTVPVVRKFLLWDLRYSDARRDVVFDRATDDVSKVQGVLFLSFAPL